MTTAAMTITFTNRPEVVLEVAGEFLASRPIAHNLILTLLHTRCGHFEPGRYWVVSDDQRPVGVVFRSPGDFPATIACVAELSSGLVAAGQRCILYADLGNSVSNSVYRRIGYEAVAECLRYRFG